MLFRLVLRVDHYFPVLDSVLVNELAVVRALRHDINIGAKAINHRADKNISAGHLPHLVR